MRYRCRTYIQTDWSSVDGDWTWADSELGSVQVTELVRLTELEHREDALLDDSDVFLLSEPA